MKLLCAIDGRVQSCQAADFAADLALRLRAGLIFCMVNALLPGRGPPILLWSEGSIAKILTEATRRATWQGVAGVDSATWHAVGVSDSIAAYADEMDIDLIVVGAGDRSALARAVGGSVSRELLRKANCPVLVVHRVRDTGPTGRGRRARPKERLSSAPAWGIAAQRLATLRPA